MVSIPKVKRILMKEKSERNTLEMVNVEGLVPQDHLLRKIDNAVDFSHIYDLQKIFTVPTMADPV